MCLIFVLKYGYLDELKLTPEKSDSQIALVPNLFLQMLLYNQPIQSKQEYRKSVFLMSKATTNQFESKWKGKVYFHSGF